MIYKNLSLNLKNKYLILPLILAGLILAFEPVIALLIMLLTLLFVNLRKLSLEKHDFLFRLITVSLFIRILFFVITVFSISLHYSTGWQKHPVFHKVIGHTTQLFRDLQREIENGERLDGYLRGDYGNASIKDVITYEEGKTRGFFLHFGVYTQGFLNFILGRSILNLFIYSIAGLWMILLVYLVAKEVFCENVAKVSSIIVAFMPSFIIWSVINIRTSMTMILILLIAYFILRFADNNHIKYIILIGISAAAINLFKFKLFLPLCLSSVLALFFGLKINLKRKLFIIFIFLIFVLSLFIVRPHILNKLTLRMEDMAMVQRAYVQEGGTTYKIYDEYIYREPEPKIPIFRFIKALPKGIFYFMLAPFPWRITHTLRLYSYPQIVLWYLILLFAPIGLLTALRYRFKYAGLVIVFLAPFTSILALSLGNEGIAARHRDLISPFIIVFASVALCNLFGYLKNYKTQDY